MAGSTMTIPASNDSGYKSDDGCCVYLSKLPSYKVTKEQKKTD